MNQFQEVNNGNAQCGARGWVKKWSIPGLQDGWVNLFEQRWVSSFERQGISRPWKILRFSPGGFVL